MASNTYEAVGNKPDVSDIITNISPSDTPLYSMLKNTRATATLHEWLEDELGESQDNAFPEGFTFYTTSVKPRKKLHNYTQIMTRGIHVTGTQEVVAKYGLTSEMRYQWKKEMKELAMDCERALLLQDRPDPGSMGTPSAIGSTVQGGTPRLFGGLPYWIITNVLDNGGTARPLTFGLVNDALQQTYEQGGKPSILLVSPRNKRVISTFTAGNTKYMPGNETHKLTQYITVLETDFGIVRTVMDWMMGKLNINDRIYGLSPEYIKKATLRNFKVETPPKISDNERRIVYGEWTLEMRAEKAHFVISDLNS